ncbi:MAG: cobyrinate a,c-diamide synthase [Lachnospiraceae bacterium]|nr:cobyrinate a,c-diamide synthase [Lachnospiraceae bacterium]
MKYRLMLAGTGSGCGKTTLTCGLLAALRMRGLAVQAYKCGPDYIDPLFHRQVLGQKTENLDAYFSNQSELNLLLEQSEADFGLIEGVMGYYDGLGATTDVASAYDISRLTDTAVVLVVPAKGMSLSVCALISGYLQFRADQRIGGIILNQVSAMFYPTMKRMIEETLSVPVLGFVPALPELHWGSRHLGLLRPSEIHDFRGQIERLADRLEDSIDWEGLLQLAEVSKEISQESSKPEESGQQPTAGLSQSQQPSQAKLRIAVAADEAFCFHYRQNLRLLTELGAEVIRFSPLQDAALPDQVDACILPGGYPELHAEALSQNSSMLQSIRIALAEGLPLLAECGGYMYLHREIEDMDGRLWPMVGHFPAAVRRQSRLQHFGYAEIEAEPVGDWNLVGVRVHEFHYYASEAGHDSVSVIKPLTGKSWRGMYSDDQMLAGFPHFFYGTAGSRQAGPVRSLLNKAAAYRKQRQSICDNK